MVLNNNFQKQINIINARLSLRSPQLQSLKILADIIEIINLSKKINLEDSVPVQYSIANKNIIYNDYLFADFFCTSFRLKLDFYLCGHNLLQISYFYLRNQNYLKLAYHLQEK